MSKQIQVAIGAILVLLIIGGGVYTLSKKSSKPAQETSAVEQKTTEEAATKGSIKSLLGMGKSLNCTFSYPSDQAETKGMVYVSSNKMRGDFTIKAEGKEMDSHMIQDGTWGYFWTTGVPQGTKMKLENLEASPTTQSSQDQSVDLNAEVDYKCSPWNADNSKFTPPPDVQFTDLSQTLKTPAQTSAPNSNNSVCDQIADPSAKAACLSATEGN